MAMLQKDFPDLIFGLSLNTKNEPGEPDYFLTIAFGI